MSIPNLVRRALLVLVATFGLLCLARVPGWVPLIWLGISALTALTPLSGLLVLAGLMPIGAAAGALWESPSWTEPLVIAFLAGAALRGVVTRRPAAAMPSLPVTLLTLILLSSCVVELTLRQLRMGPGPFREVLEPLLSGHYFAMTSDLGSLGAAALFLEGLALLVAVAAIVRHEPARLLRVAKMMTAGAAGAAVLNLSRLVTTALASEQAWQALLQLARSMRISVLFHDVNAAGSYFAMLLWVALGVVVVSRRERRLAWGGATLLIAAALWITSSRAAILALLAVGGIWTALSLLRPRGGQTALPKVAGVVGVALVTVMVVAFLPNRVIGGNATIAAQIRRDMAIVSVRLLAREPAFGIGIGQFYEQSGPEMQRLPVGRRYVRENAHNNFLQILAELGTAGFAGFMLLLATLAHRLWRTYQSRAEARPLVGTLAAALATFLMSALFGHPLLTPECAFAFWILAGAAASFVPEAPAGRLTRRLGLAACALILISVPLRARAIIRDADLEHLGYGLSLWETAEDGQRYRIADGVATIFVPGDAAVVVIPLRTSTGSETAFPVSVRLRGTLVDQLMIPGTPWTRYTFSVPARERSRFVPLELELHGDPAARLHIGKVSVLQPRAR